MTPLVPDIPFMITLASGALFGVHVDRIYELRYHSLSSARQDWEMRATLRRIQTGGLHDPVLVFNGSPRFGDKDVRPGEIQRIMQVRVAGAESASYHRAVPALPKARPPQAVGYRVLELSEGRRQGNEGRDDIYDDLQEALDAAQEKGETTRVTYNGRPYAVIIPPDTAEALQAFIDAVTTVAAERRARPS